MSSSIKKAAIAAAMFSLAACAPEVTTPQDEAAAVGTEAQFPRDYIALYVDPQTNCEYLVYTDYKKGGIIPRMKADGRPRCEGGK